MIIKYKVYDQRLKVIITENILDTVLDDLKNLNSDKKVLFVYDRRIDEETIKNFATNLKTSGCSVFFFRINW